MRAQINLQPCVQNICHQHARMLYKRRARAACQWMH